ncbi:TetR/AcrR family transcriptional repressor of bet genes [Catenulispora sp. MAP12-49]|uniref:TetR/AcrR family transcriptional regulator n=1 Tax=Catenulispora sp. MAP12-49 TaxID=3156302 RepID=UPI003519BD1C
MAPDSRRTGGGDAPAAPDRRTDLLDRLADLIAESGVEGVSIRTLATRAEVSIGTVQYYFATKDELLRAVWLHVREQSARRFRDPGTARLSPTEHLDQLIGLLLAPDPGDRLSRVWLALAARAAHDPGIAELHRDQWRETEELLARALAAVKAEKLGVAGDAVDEPDPADPADPADAAAELLALLDGLTIAVLTEPERMPATRALRIARTWTASWCQP